MNSTAVNDVSSMQLCTMTEIIIKWDYWFDMKLEGKTPNKREAVMTNARGGH